MPARYKTNKKALEYLMKQALEEHPNFFSQSSMYVLNTCCLRKRRKPTSKADLARMELTMPYGGLCVGTPDFDNFAGTIADSANRILFKDDSQIVIGRIERRWADFHGALIEFEKLGEYSA